MSHQSPAGRNAFGAHTQGPGLWAHKGVVHCRPGREGKRPLLLRLTGTECDGNDRAGGSGSSCHGCFCLSAMELSAAEEAAAPVRFDWRGEPW